MGRLMYLVLASLDGYTADANGNFDWAMPDEAVHRAVNDLEAEATTHLYGRRMYEVMRWWDDPANLAGEPQVVLDFAATWQAADKWVFSRTLTEVTTRHTRLEREFDPAAIRRLKAATAGGLSVGGAGLAGACLQAGLVDDLHFFAFPLLVGGGLHWLPPGLRLDLRLADHHRFDNGVVHLHYTVGA